MYYRIDGSLCDGRVLRAAHGTTKYCSSYLRGQPCPNPNCMFLHEPGEEADSYTRKDLSTQQGIKMGMTARSHTTSFVKNPVIIANLTRLVLMMITTKPIRNIYHPRLIGQQLELHLEAIRLLSIITFH